MVVKSKVGLSWWHEMFCHVPEVIGSNPGWAKLEGRATYIVLMLKVDLNKKYYHNVYTLVEQFTLSAFSTFRVIK